MRKGDARWSNISAAGGANAGTAAMGLAGSLFGKALQTAEDGLTKHQEELEKNVASEKAANTALILKMKSEGKPVSKDFMKQLGVYDGAEINEGSMKLRAEQQDRLMNNHRMSMDNQKFAQSKLKDQAQIANWNSTAKARNAESKMSPLQRMLIKDKMDKNMLTFKQENGMMWNPNTGKSGSTGKGGNVMNIAKDMAEIFDVPLNQTIDDATTLARIKKEQGTQAYNEALAEIGSQVDHDAFRKNDMPGNWGSMF